MKKFKLSKKYYISNKVIVEAKAHMMNLYHIIVRLMQTTRFIESIYDYKTISVILGHS